MELSRYYGRMPDHVQAGGGNTSFKCNDGFMAIKASGLCLKDVTEKRGFVTLERQSILNLFLREEQPSEAEYVQLVDSVYALQNARPSMESGFHALIDSRYVLHTHSALINVLLCSDDARPLLDEIYKEQPFSYIEYVTPGIPLSFAVGQVESIKRIVLLENHGIIVHSDDVTEVRKIYDDFHALVKKVFELNGVCLPEYPSSGASGFHVEQADLFDEDMQNILIPDQAIYFSLRDAYKIEEGTFVPLVCGDKAVALEQMVGLVAYLKAVYKQNAWSPRYIGRASIGALLNLDSEKYRQQKV